MGLATAILVVWTVFPFAWMLLTSLKEPRDMLAVPPKIVFQPTTENYEAILIGKRRGLYASARPDFPRFFVNSVVISTGAVALSVAAGSSPPTPWRASPSRSRNSSPSSS